MRTTALRALLTAVLAFGFLTPTWTAAQDSGEISLGDTVSIDTDGVNIRDDFGTDGEVITTLEVGTTLEILDGPETADGFSWWLAEILDEDSVDQGVSGWLVADYLAVDDVESPPDDGDDPTETPVPTKTPTPSPTGTPDDSETDFENAKGIEVLDGPVNIRERAGTSADVVGSLQTGDVATVVSGSEIETANSYNWIEIEIGAGETGWMATAFLKALDEDPCADDACSPVESDNPLLDASSVEVFDGPLNVRAAAGLDGDLVDTVPTGTFFNVAASPSMETADGFEWLSVDYLGDVVFVATDFVTESVLTCEESPCVQDDQSGEDNPFATADDVVVVDGPLNLRTDPGTSTDVLEVLNIGDTLPTVSGQALVTADGYTWVKVSRLSGTPREGWLATEFLDVGEGDGGSGSGGLDSFVDAEGAFVSEGPLNVRANPDTGADVLMRLETNDYVWIDALDDEGSVWEADGYTWIRVTVAGEIGYVAIDFLTPA